MSSFNSLRIQRIVDQLNPDELSVLERIAKRLLMGQKQYGELNLANDKRDWNEELRQELLDVIVYAVIAMEATKPTELDRFVTAAVEALKP
jgi:hypothetical protein